MPRKRGVYCAALWCNNFHGCRVDEPYSFFHFPKDPRRFSQWVKFSLRSDLIGKTPAELKSLRLCSAHFHKNEMRKNFGRTILSRSAIPTIVEENLCPENVSSLPTRSVLGSEDAVLGAHMPVPSSSSHDGDVLLTDDSIGNVCSISVATLDSEDVLDTDMLGPSNSSSHDTDEFPTDGSIGTEPLTPTCTGKDVWNISTIKDAVVPRSSPTDTSAFHDENTGDVICINNSSACVATADWIMCTDQDVNIPGPSNFLPAHTNIVIEDTAIVSTPEPRTPQRMGRISSRSKVTPRTNARINRFRRNLSIARAKLFRCNRLPPTKPTREKELGRVLKSAAKFMPTGAFNIFKLQLKFSQVNKFGRRYPAKYKNFALNLYYHSPRTYRFLRKTLYLPSVTTLLNWQKCIDVKPGVDMNTISALRDKAMKLAKTQPVALIMDEISIKEHFQYDSRSDTIIGFCNDGVQQTATIGTHCLVFMIKGLAQKWKQTLGYWVTNEKSKSAVSDLLVAVERCIDSLHEINYRVKLLICDQSPHNQALSVKLGVAIDTPFFFRGEEKVFFMFDTTHLLKNLRNNLSKYNLDYDGQIVKWSYFRDLYDSIDPLKLRMIPKITRQHVEVRAFKKMKVKLAAQAFSNSVSVAICTFVKMQQLPAEAYATGDFFGDVDKAFDTFNSVYSKEHPYKFNYAISEESPNYKFLQTFYEKLDRSKFMNCRRQPPCLRGWLLNIKSLFGLCVDLKENFSIPAVCTRNINQDCLENLFSIIRQQHGCSSNPTLAQFSKGLKHHILTTLPKLSASSNCEIDIEYVFTQVAEFLKAHQSSEQFSEEDREEMPVFDYSNLEITDEVEESTIYYVAGYLCMHYLKGHVCEKCRNILTEAENCRVLQENNQLFTYLKGYESLRRDFGGLTLPKREVFEVIKEWEARFQTVFQNVQHMPKLCLKIKEIFLEDPDLQNIHLCSQNSTTAFLLHFIRIRVLWAVKFLNRQRIEGKLSRLQSHPGNSLLNAMHL